MTNTMIRARFSRRRFLKTAALLTTAGALGAAGCHTRKYFLVNPCRAAMPASLAESPWLARVWRGLDPAQVWDCHVHLAGVGDSGSGIVLGAQFSSPMNPLFYARRWFYMNGACASVAGAVDKAYVERLLEQVAAMPDGVKLMLFAFDYCHDDAGRALPEKSAFYIPDDYARDLAAACPERFEWVASIHPYRPDAVDRLEKAVAQGARAIKWLPAAQNIDPASSRCAAFHAALARLRIPLITHCGAEKAMRTETLYYSNPLRLRRALEAGARVIIAHCSSAGEDADIDRDSKPRSSFELFARLMDEPEWRENLCGDISAIVLRNRKPQVLKTLLSRRDWHNRLLNGSDYPLPGILPLISPAALAADGLLPEAAVADLELLREYNPIYFDLALKRTLSWQGQGFPAEVFATRRFFTPPSAWSRIPASPLPPS
jgi:mannonate dehydratase